MKLSQAIVSKLRSQGHFMSIHLRFEMNMLSFAGCFDIFTPAEQKILKKYREENFAQKELVYSERRTIGKCPLTQKRDVSFNALSGNLSQSLSALPSVNSISKQQDLQNLLGAMYYATLFLGAGNVASVQSIVAVERTVFYREKAAGMYSALPYAFAQIRCHPINGTDDCCWKDKFHNCSWNMDWQLKKCIQHYLG